ncbi:MAG: N-acetylmuramoyl-L-alanine amidase [Alphaproteobacteria bacterium]|nr:MAG: N-acetylmuramoyl-L-alanine amidase [Alphaproteobacteria bacterium]
MRIIDHLSGNHDARPAGGAPDMLVLHYTGMRSLDEALERLCDPQAKVSAHYLIAEDGRVFRLVDEERRAWHAGVAEWEGVRDINGRSIGIELENPGHAFGYRAFPEPQIRALMTLAADIVARHRIRASRIVAHSDVAPMRKQDPGELFPWARLADEAGLGLWMDAQGLSMASAGESSLDLLARFGYGVAQNAGEDDEVEQALVRAFQRHFRPARIDGLMDAECRAILARLVAAKEAEEASTGNAAGRRTVESTGVRKR